MDLPFLFTSAEEANEVLNSTDIGEQIFADFGDYDLVIWLRATTVCVMFPPSKAGVRSRRLTT